MRVCEISYYWLGLNGLPPLGNTDGPADLMLRADAVVTAVRNSSQLIAFLLTLLLLLLLLLLRLRLRLRLNWLLFWLRFRLLLHLRLLRLQPTTFVRTQRSYTVKHFRAFLITLLAETLSISSRNPIFIALYNVVTTYFILASSLDLNIIFTLSL